MTVTVLLLRWVAPLVSPSQEKLIALVEAKFGYPVEIAQVEILFEGLQPKVALKQVKIFSPDHQLGFSADQITLLLNVPQLFFQRVKIDAGCIEGAYAQVEYHRDGLITVEGLPEYQLNLKQPHSAHSVLSLPGSINIKKSKLALKWENKQFALSDLNLDMQARSVVKIRGSAKIGQEGEHLNFAADVPTLSLPLHHKPISLHLQWIGAKVADTATFFPDLPLTPTQGKLNLNTWVEIHPNHDIALNAEMVFEDLNIKTKSGVDFSVPALTGYLTYEDQQGKCHLKGEKGQIKASKVFSSPLNFADLLLLMDFELSKQGITLQANSLQAKVNNNFIQGAFSLKLPLGKQKALPIEMKLQADHAKIADVLTLLPRRKVDKELLTWLDDALLDGEMLGMSMVLRGDLRKFPFDHQEGVFEISTQLDKVHFNYDKDWPEITELSADLLFHQRSLKITAKKGNIAGGQILDTVAVIPDLAASNPQLTVDTEIVGTLEEGMKVLQKSPLQTTVKELETLTVKGDMALSLGLIIPLANNSHETKVKGVIEVNDATVGVPDWRISVDKLKGAVSFTENSIYADKLQGKLFDESTQFRLASNNHDQELHIKALGHVTLGKLQKWLKIKAIPGMVGESDYQADLIIPHGENKQHPTIFNVRSNLVGIAVNTPEPFAKASDTALSLEFKMHSENDLMHVGAKYGDDLNIAYSLLSKDHDWHPIGGHIHFGEKRLAKFREDGILLIDGDVNELDVQKWQEYLTTVGLSPLSPNEDKKGLEQLVSLSVDKLNLYGAIFTQTKIEAAWEEKEKQWNVGFNGPALRGNVRFPHHPEQEIRADLQHIVLTKADKFSQFFTKDQASSPRHPLLIHINHFIHHNKEFDNIVARIVPNAGGYAIPNLTAKMKGTNMIVSGQWDYLTPIEQVSVTGNLRTKNISHTFKALALESTLHKAKGTIHFALQWLGSPANIDYETLSGSLDFTLNKGTVHGMDPGMGRILGLLNFDNVQRRLALDFSDVTRSGFAFNELTGKLNFGKGKISTNNIHLNSPSAKIQAFGQADFKTQMLNGEMIVMPDVTGTFPVAAAIAVNPAVGAAVWAADKIFGSTIQEMHRYRYKVRGTWNTPKVEQVALE
ncbi:MAG: YhdP family protein [Candidatus Berkiellales bacterium]